MDLRDIGIGEGWLCEAIVTTYHEDGSPNAAPMGVRGGGRDVVVLKVHRDTDTYENILRGRCCVINIVFDPLLFLRCALYGRHKGPSEIEAGDVEPADHVDAPYLVGASAYVEAELEEVEDFAKSDAYGMAMGSKMTLRVRDIRVLSPFPAAPNRGFFAAMELAIALSRGRTEDVPRYMEVIKKTLPEERSLEIEGFVKGYVRSIS